MKTMKKTLTALLVLVLCLMLLAGCSSSGASTPEKTTESTTEATTAHVHVAIGEYELNDTEHWLTCECGEKMEVAAHTATDVMDMNLDQHWTVCICGQKLETEEHTWENTICTGCGAEMWDMGDGYVSLYAYNEFGELIRNMEYIDGVLSLDNRTRIEYNESGQKVREDFYENGRLTGYSLYGITDEGMEYQAASAYYSEDGSSVITEYDEHGNSLSVCMFDAENEPETEYVSQYAQKDTGEYYEQFCTIHDYKNNYKIELEYTQYGDPVTRTKTLSDGTVEYAETYDREYDENGDMLWEKTYTDGILTHEICGYITVSDEYGYMRFPEKTIDYNEDGSRMELVNGMNGNTETETYYNADGSVEKVLRYEYEYAEDGNYSAIRLYEDDRILEEILFSFDSESGYTYESQKTEYAEDGSKTVTHFNTAMEVTLTEKFDAAGNKVE